MTTAYADGVDAVRADGALVHIRTAMPEDLEGLTELHDRASDRSLYLRFFSAGRECAQRYLPSLVRPADGDHHTLLALMGDRVVGVAEFERVSPEDAEVALLIDDEQQREGIGTLLIEHLAEAARDAGYRCFVAETLAENLTVLRLFTDLGLPIEHKFEDGSVQVRIQLQIGPGAIAASDRREAVADAASLAPILAPHSVAVIGASARPGSIGHQVLRNIVDCGYTGLVYAVNPHCDSILGVQSVASPADLPVAPDLAVIAVPAASVLGVVRACGARGTRGVVLLTSGFGELGEAGRAQEREIVRAARHYGMRLIGPNCLGVLNTDPAVRLNATFAALPMQDGGVALASQSGALGIAVAAVAARSGVGIAQFVSMGNKVDVSSNDLLMSWERDRRVKVIALYLESFGNPRKFARIARRIAATKPIIAIKGGRTPAGELAGRSHTAAAASSDVVVDALFTDAGVLRVDTIEELLDAARVLGSQPVPSGTRVAIVGNSGGPQILAADAAAGAGLDVVTLSDETIARLLEVAPRAASHHNPVDLSAAADAGQVGRAVQVLLEAPEVDAVLTVFTETAVGDPVAVLARIAQVALGSTKPVVATQVGGAVGVTPARDDSAPVPVFAFPEPAARAIAVAARYGQIRAAIPAPAVPLGGVDRAAARELVAAARDDGTDWLDADQTARLLIHYGITVCPQRVVGDADAAAAAAIELGYPLVVKAAGGGLHKSELGAVRVGIADERELRTNVAEIAAAVPGTDILLQPMLAPGTELIVGALQDQRFGPVVMIGAGGVLSDLLADRQFALAPLDEAAAARLVGRLRTAPLLDGYRGRPVVPRAAVADVIARIAQLVDDVPEIAELDLNPIICHGSTLTVVDARIRVAPAPRVPDPVLRQMADR
ncbi:GNAT family N-acetyltransferase [Jatrophihabitans cynanchi]|jgi:acyl-CoA synthetase (NDP forming)/GNAT superfamily N-acetyltransferase|uniref:GNAT family N-acetyltransferase n=1 Tax=Jatrophihabitans cynanchi TaxID=2944128 RepID=A0ABY7K3E8_9ACTN|nr:bifunctional GNAT family N-acetyltransferase/acetate--CoA ligase family protein [Jatrophihabitans sp. SB3-54]WAX57636.1 GNAT family N-acetyltransferase [Jatrophihabitans sp. SB3-54]